MKVYQLKLCVRGNPAAMQTVLVEAEDYKLAIVKSIEKLAKMNNIAVEELAVQDIKVIEEFVVASVAAPESIDILRVDEARRRDEIIGEEKK